MRILWVKVGGLWPPNTGGRLRSFHLVSELSRRHAVTLLTTHAPGDDPEVHAERLSRCWQIVSMPRAIPKRGSARFAFALLRSWLSALPVDLLKFRASAFARVVRRFLEQGGFDLCVADFLSATVNLPVQNRLPLILFEHNVEHLIWKRLCEVEGRPWRRALLALEWRKLRRHEARACLGAASTFAVSDTDRALLSAAAPGALVRTIPTGVDTSYFAPGRSPEAPGTLVFTGSMDWHPNEDAVLHFLHAVLPRIRREVPQASFSVVGRNPTPRLLAAAAQAAVRVTGTVEDVRPYVAEAAVFVVPLRIGGGTRHKIFEALAMGEAVVSTRVGAEGLPLVPGTHFIQEDDPDRFAREAVALLRDPDRRRSLGTAGRRLVEEHYSWAQAARRFEALCEEAIAEHRPRPRRVPPVGAAKAIVDAAFPRAIVDHLRAWRNLEPRARAIYWRSRLPRLFGARRAASSPPVAPIRSVLFVCHGNIIRSPMAAALLERSLRDLKASGPSVASAGLHAVRGQRADPRARIAARRFGISLDDHRARPLTPEQVGQSDLIIAMDALNEAALLARYPGARHKISLLGASAGNGRGIEFADPFDGDEEDIRRCYALLETAVRAQARTLRPPASAGCEAVSRHAS